MEKLRIITVKEVECVAYTLARENMAFREPIPEFSSRFPNILESCIAVPFQVFSGRHMYPSLYSKAAILFYLMIKNRPFRNGNKRIAMTTLLVFLYINKKWLEVDNQELYNFAMWVTESNARLKAETAKAIEKFLKLHIKNI